MKVFRDKISHFWKKFVTLHRKTISYYIMTAVQMGALNAEIFHNIGAIAEDESKLRKLAKYLRRLVNEDNDPTLLSKEKFFAKLTRLNVKLQKENALPSTTWMK